jgi:putative membrane protein
MTGFEPPGEAPPDRSGAHPAAGPSPPFPPPPVAATAPVPLHVPRRTSPLSIAFEMLAILFGVAFVVSSFDADWLLMFSVVSSTLGLVAVAFRWWFRTYTVTEERLLLDEGVLRRRNRVVPFARVQQVNVTQELFHRLFGVAALEVETAGEGGTSSISLRVLRRADAEALRSFALERRRVLSQITADGGRASRVGEGRAGAGAGAAAGTAGVTGDGDELAPTRVPPFAAERTLGRMTTDDLVIAGVTRSVVLGAAAVYAALGAPWLAVGAAADGMALAGLQSLAVLLGGVVLVGLLTALTSMTRSLLRDWGWTLTEQGDDLHVRRGLLEVRSQSLPRRRIQQVTIVDNPVRRLLGVVSVAVHTAAMPGSHQMTTVQVPLVRRSELDAFLTALMGPAWVLPPLQPRSETARRRALRRRALLLLVICGTPVVWQPRVLWILLPLALAAWPWGVTAHRRAGLAVTGDRVVFASGVLHHRIDVAPRNRIQSTRTSASPLQRRVGLATLHADLAGTTWRGPLRLSARLFDVETTLAARLRSELPRRAPSGAAGQPR